jgi:hypothetical protein
VLAFDLIFPLSKSGQQKNKLCELCGSSVAGGEQKNRCPNDSELLQNSHSKHPAPQSLLDNQHCWAFSWDGMYDSHITVGAV